MILVGELSLWVGLLMAVWAMTVSFAGANSRRLDLIASGQRAVYAVFVMTLLSAIGLWTAIFSHDFSIKYVSSFTSRNLPKVYLFTSLWAGQAGSLLFWMLVLSAFGAIAVFSNRNKHKELMPYVTGTIAFVMVFFLATLCLGANPFERLDWIPPDGRGMNPQLQNPGMAIHPPMLYLGFIATTIPFAFAVGALFTRRLNSEWLVAVRRWTLLAWFFLTIGIVLGMWWAYVELGWGGYWAWDPVENASLLPWLILTAFLHSVMVQEKRGMLRKWNVTLIISAFLLTIFGTFITRSGIIASVHSFAQSPIGPWFAGFLIVGIIGSAYLVTTRLKDLKAEAELESMVSREAAFLYNNLVLVGIAFSVLWGTLFPVISEAVKGDRITVGPPFFNTVNIPLGLLLLLLTGIGPLIAWRRASMPNLKRQFLTPLLVGIAVAVVLVAFGMRNVYALVSYLLAGFVAATIVQEFYKGVRARMKMYSESLVAAFFKLIAKNRRRYGGYIVHAGIVIIFAAFAGYAFKTEHDVNMKAGDSVTLKDPWGKNWTFTSQGVSNFDVLNRSVTAMALELSREGKPAGFLTSERRQYFAGEGPNRVPTFQPSTEVGILESWSQDVYLTFVGVVGEGEGEIRIAFNPLVRWVWFGGFLMAIGGLIVMWPQAAARSSKEGGYITSLKSENSVVGLA